MKKYYCSFGIKTKKMILSGRKVEFHGFSLFYDFRLPDVLNVLISIIICQISSFCKKEMVFFCFKKYLNALPNSR